MSKLFPTDKDEILNDLVDEYEIELTDEEYDRLRELTTSQLLLVTILAARIHRKKEANT